MDLAAFEQAERGLRSSLNGDLRICSAHEILSWLAQTRRSAILKVGEGLGASTVFVRNGHVFRAEHGPERGEVALESLFLQTAGRFQLLLRAPPDAHPNVLTSTDELLLRAASLSTSPAGQPASIAG